MNATQTALHPTAPAAPWLVIDTLGSLANPNLDDGGNPVDAVDSRALDDAYASGLAAVHQTVGYVGGDGDPYLQTLADLDDWDRLLDAFADRLHRVRQSGDIAEARRTGRIGVIYGFQNGAMVADDPGRVTEFARRGVRVVQLTYNGVNALGEGAMAPGNGGLTPVGHEVVEALNEARLMVDLSHSGERTCREATAASRIPVIISHTGCRALADLPRNKTDAEMRAVAERGGLVGIYFMPFLAIGRQPTSGDLLAHLEHAIDVCGDEHVCIGTDGASAGIDDMAYYRAMLAREVAERQASGIGATGERADIVPFLPDLEGPGRFRRLAELLEARGHAAARIERVLGGNFLRYAREVWG